jgi:hypothetical protein
MREFWGNMPEAFVMLLFLFGWTVLLPVLFVLFTVLDAATWERRKPSQFKKHFVTLIILLVPLSVVYGTLVAAIDAVWRQTCVSHLKGITLAFHNYHDAHGSFPPAYTVDENGKPLHSWRVLLLPYLDGRELYDKIRLDEPWDSEYNQQFHGIQPKWYQCQASIRNAIILSSQVRFNVFTKNHDVIHTGNSDFSVVIGEETVFPGSGKTVSYADITDGSANTILIVERMIPVNWMDPHNEIRFEVASKRINRHPLGIGSRHSFGWVLVGLADGRIQALLPSTDIKPLLTKSAGD